MSKIQKDVSIFHVTVLKTKNFQCYTRSIFDQNLIFLREALIRYMKFLFDTPSQTLQPGQPVFTGDRSSIKKKEKIILVCN